MTGSNRSGSAPQWARDRCEVCNRVIGQRPDQRKRRCAEHLDERALFPVSACKKKKRGGGRR